MTIEGIVALLKGKEFQYNDEVRIYPVQAGIFLTHEELANIIRDRTNMTERLLKLMEASR